MKMAVMDKRSVDDFML